MLEKLAIYKKETIDELRKCWKAIETYSTSSREIVEALLKEKKDNEGRLNTLKPLAEVLWRLEDKAPCFTNSFEGRQTISDILCSSLDVEVLEKQLAVLEIVNEVLSSCGQEESIVKLLRSCSENITETLEDLARVCEWIREMEFKTPGYVDSSNGKEQISKILSSSVSIDLKLEKLTKLEGFAKKKKVKDMWGLEKMISKYVSCSQMKEKILEEICSSNSTPEGKSNSAKRTAEMLEKLEKEKGRYVDSNEGKATIRNILCSSQEIEKKLKLLGNLTDERFSETKNGTRLDKGRNVFNAKRR